MSGSSVETHPAVAAAVSRSARWHAVEHRREVTSTLDVALERLRAGAPPGLVVVADRQTAGRGRGGRGWTDVEAPHGPGSLAVTAAAAAPPGGAVGLVPFAAGVAVAAAYAAVGAGVALKWPNDVLLTRPGERAPTAKAAGILVERHAVPGGDVVLIGCGLDLDWRGVARSGDAAAWTSLAEAVAADVDRGSVLADLLVGLDRGLDLLAEEPRTVLDEYRQRCATLGVQVRADRPDGTVVAGVARDLDETGALVVATDAGAVTVTAGDVHHVRPA